MATVPNLTVFDVITDFLASHPSNEAILAYRLPETLEQRALDLMSMLTASKLKKSHTDLQSNILHPLSRRLRWM